MHTTNKTNHIYRHTDRKPFKPDTPYIHTDRQTNIHTRQRDKQRDILSINTIRQTYTHTYIHTYIHTYDAEHNIHTY